MNTEIKPRPEINMTPVVSSQIAAIGHDPKTNTMAIQFPHKHEATKQGSVYHYQNVSPEVFEEFKSAESIGAYFGKHIRPHSDKYPYEQIS